MSNLNNQSCGCGSRNFDAVWQRVLPGLDAPIPSVSGRNPQNFSDEEFLISAMEKCCADSRISEAIACRCRGNMIGRTCETLACRERAQFQTLHTTYFILTGNNYTIPRTCPSIGRVLDALRIQCIEKTENSRMFQEAAELTSDEKIACICRQLAEEESENACTLERLICRML